MPSASSAQQANFELLVGALRGNWEGYVHNVWATLAALLLAVGWILTSREARLFLAGSHAARRIAALTVLLVAAIHALALLECVRASNRLLDLAARDPHVVQSGLDLAYLDHYRVTPLFAAASLLLDGSLFALLLALLTRLKGWVEPSDHSAPEEPRRTAGVP